VKTPTLLGPLERANLNHWMFLGFWLAEFKRYNFLKEGYISGAYRLCKQILKGSDDCM
jgi:hypothetical protein